MLYLHKHTIQTHFKYNLKVMNTTPYAHLKSFFYKPRDWLDPLVLQHALCHEGSST